MVNIAAEARLITRIARQMGLTVEASYSNQSTSRYRRLIGHCQCTEPGDCETPTYYRNVDIDINAKSGYASIHDRAAQSVLPPGFCRAGFCRA